MLLRYFKYSSLNAHITYGGFSSPFFSKIGPTWQFQLTLDDDDHDQGTDKEFVIGKTMSKLNWHLPFQIL